MLPATRPKACIVYLVRSKERNMNLLIRSLRLLKRNFLDQFPYPVIIFIEKDFPEAWKDTIQKRSNVPCHFEYVNFSLPAHLSVEEVDIAVEDQFRVINMSFPVGYRHMCHFFSKDIYRHPALKEFDWYWRLDDDSFLLSKIPYDVFSFMNERNFTYGYNRIYDDSEWCTRGLGEAVQSYVIEKSIQPSFFHKFSKNGIWDRSMYSTNFEISKFDFWRSQTYQDFIEYIDNTNGIYLYRWGDAPIRLLAVSIFLPEEQVHAFTDIAYKHQEFVNFPNPMRNFLEKIKRRCLRIARQRLRTMKLTK